MRDGHGAGRGDDVEDRLAEPPPYGDVGADQARWHRVVVAPHRHQRVRRHLAHQDDLGRIRDGRQAQQRLGVRQRPDRGVATATPIRGRGAEPVQAGLRLGA